MLSRFIGKRAATDRIEEILNKFDEQVITLEDAGLEISEEITLLTNRAERLSKLRTRAYNVAAKLRELVTG